MEIAIVAGEVSGDIQGARLVEELKNIHPDLKVWGIGGENMQNQGVNVICDITHWALIGFWEVLKKYTKIRKVFYQILGEIEEKKPDAVILIDYPGFNLRLAEKVKKLGIPIIYYISPQVWAWGKKRVKQIARLVSKMIVIFPFEEELYKKADVSVDFVGHPIMDVLESRENKREDIRNEFGLENGDQLVGIFPGSREQEIRRHLPVFLDVSKVIKQRKENVKFVIGAASAEVMEQIKGITSEYPIVCGRAYDVMEASDLVLTSSGTATLETACFGTPMVVIYKLSCLTYAMIKRLINVPHIAMANVVAQRRIVPEFVQEEANVENISREAIDILENDDRQNKIKNDLAIVRKALGGPGAARRAAKVVSEVLKNRV